MIYIAFFKKNLRLLVTITIICALVILVPVGCFPDSNPAGHRPRETKNKQARPFVVENPDFEQPILQNWSVSGARFLAELDPTTAAHGRQSLRLSFDPEADDSGLNPLRVVSTRLPAASFQGKRIRLSASIKTRNAGPSPLWVRADVGEKNPAAFTRLPWKECSRGTKDWQRYSIEMDIPADTTALCCGAAYCEKCKKPYANNGAGCPTCKK